MKIAVAADHAGVKYKEVIKRLLEARGEAVLDCGTSREVPGDHPRIVRPVAEGVARGLYDRAIVVGRSGNGEAMAANRVRGGRCAWGWNRKRPGSRGRTMTPTCWPSATTRYRWPPWRASWTLGLYAVFSDGRHERRIRLLDADGTAPPITAPQALSSVASGMEFPDAPARGGRAPGGRIRSFFALAGALTYGPRRGTLPP